MGALFNSVDLFYEKYMCDYWIKINRKKTGFGGRLTIFGNNWNNTALVQGQSVGISICALRFMCFVPHFAHLMAGIVHS